jgi:hypothetical protein
MMSVAPVYVYVVGAHGIAAATSYPSLAHRSDDFVQRKIRQLVFGSRNLNSAHLIATN